ncbi:ADP-ribosylation factor-like protein 10 isoform X1 [Phyllobates terribilis]|uniref:ADP-ribosylation factor-like protein 10 isoform X1 n=1 Tax=Phyllobates terribilis TaxID=111132 RepID=UPI003CCAC54A
MAALRNLSMVIGAAVAALGSVLFIAWRRYVPGRRKWRRTGYELEHRRDQNDYLDQQILVLGLDGAGKSSIIHAMSTNTTRSSSAPTHGFNTAQIVSQGLRIELLEVGGSQNLRTYWNQYLKKTHFLVFVVDSTDDIRLQLARHELHRLLEEAPGLPLMVLANKQGFNGQCKEQGGQRAPLPCTSTRSKRWGEVSIYRIPAIGLPYSNLTHEVKLNPIPNFYNTAHKYPDSTESNPLAASREPTALSPSPSTDN